MSTKPDPQRTVYDRSIKSHYPKCQRCGFVPAQVLLQGKKNPVLIPGIKCIPPELICHLCFSLEEKK
jgi:hypothetical protein